MVVLETHVFSRRIDRLLSPDEYREFQVEFAARPTAGAAIPGTGGLRKVQWSASGRGKRGGIRVVYFYHKRSDQILLLFAFAKNERADLTKAQKDQLRRIVEREYPS